MNRISGQLLSPFKPFQLNQEIEGHDFSSKLPDQADRRFSRPPRRQEIIDDQDPLARPDRISMNCQSIRAILKTVLHLKAIRRQLPRLADRDKPGAEPTGQHAAKDKSSRLDAYDFINAAALIAHGEFVRKTAKRRRIFEQGSNVVEENAGLWEIRHFADEGLIIDGTLRR